MCQLFSSTIRQLTITNVEEQFQFANNTIMYLNYFALFTNLTELKITSEQNDNSSVLLIISACPQLNFFYMQQTTNSTISNNNNSVDLQGHGLQQMKLSTISSKFSASLVAYLSTNLQSSDLKDLSCQNG